MGKKLQITLSEEASEKYLAMARAKTGAEVNADCEPSGCKISIEIGSSVYGSCAYFHQGNERIELGEAEVDFV